MLYTNKNNVYIYTFLFLLFLATSSFLISCKDNRNHQPSKSNLRTLKKTVLIEIGKNSENNPNAELGRISDAYADYKGNLWVGDIMAMSVKVFDVNGNLIKELGERAESPKDFFDITSIFGMHDDQIGVYDKHNSKVNIYDGFFNLINSVKVLWGGNSAHLQKINNGYLLNVFDDSGFIYFTGKNDWMKEVKSFRPLGSLDDIGYNGIDINIRYFDLVGNKVNISILDDKVSISPRILQKGIVTYKIKDTDYQKTKTIYGLKYQNENIRFNMGNKAVLGSFHESISLNGQKMFIKYFNESKGLFYLSNGDLAHFTFIQINTTRDLGIELYQKGTDVPKYYIIQKFPLLPEGKIGVSDLLPLAKDKEDNFYFKKEGRFESIQKIKFTFESNN